MFCQVRAEARGERPLRWHEGLQLWKSVQEVHNDLEIAKPSVQEDKIVTEGDFSADPGIFGDARLSLARDYQFQRHSDQYARRKASGIEGNGFRQHGSERHGYVYGSGFGIGETRQQREFRLLYWRLEPGNGDGRGNRVYLFPNNGDDDFGTGQRPSYERSPHHYFV
jgi:hypothetical protein